MRQILALSGGGYRGLFSAKVLSELAKGVEGPIQSKFDVIAGTSIGGIMAIGLILGKSPTEIRDAFDRYGTEIFSRRAIPIPFTKRRVPLPNLGITVGRYGQDGLKKAITEILGDDAEKMLSEIDIPLLVVAVNRTTAEPLVFTSPPLGPKPPFDISLKDLALATSAAPTYFPEHAVAGQNLIDGGVIANSPDLLALLEVMLRWEIPRDRVRLLSIGTAGGDVTDRYRPPRNYGAIRWMTPTIIGGRRLFEVTIAAQEEMAMALARRLLTPRFVRIDIAPGSLQASSIGLDKPGADATQNLESLAIRAVADLKTPDRQIIAEMMRHTVRP